MADDARISTALPRHPKTVRLLRRLQERGGWGLLCLFLWVAENRPDGNLKGLTGEDIEIAAGWMGEPGAFSTALTEVGFLEGEDGAYTVHDWIEHNPWVASRGKRIEAARAAASIRWDRVRQATRRDESKSNGNRTHPASGGHAIGNADLMPTTQPNPTQPNHTIKPCGAVAPAEWIPADAWAGFIEMRKKIRAPLTERAITLIVRQLEKLRADGHEVGAVLDQSTRNNWKDVYPLKGDQRYGKHTAANGNRAEQRQTINLAAAAAVKRDLGLDG